MNHYPFNNTWRKFVIENTRGKFRNLPEYGGVYSVFILVPGKKRVLAYVGVAKSIKKRCQTNIIISKIIRECTIGKALILTKRFGEHPENCSVERYLIKRLNPHYNSNIKAFLEKRGGDLIKKITTGENVTSFCVKLERIIRDGGASQRYIIKKMAELGQPLTDVQFTNKKQTATFTAKELKVLGKVLKTKIIQ